MVKSFHIIDAFPQIYRLCLYLAIVIRKRGLPEKTAIHISQEGFHDTNKTSTSSDRGWGAIAASSLAALVPFWGTMQKSMRFSQFGRTSFISLDSIPVSDRPTDLVYLAPFVDKVAKWGPDHLFTFINAMSAAHLDPLGKAFEITEFEEKSKPSKIKAIHEEILWQSSNVFTYAFKSLEEIDYHQLVVWCSSKVGIPKNEARFTSTFDLERQILERQFIDMWDRLDEQKRRELLQNIDASGQIEKANAIVAMSGTAALIALSGTVYFMGFSFYTTMSVIVATAASWFSISLPFTAYMTASSTMAALTGPIGWTIAAVWLTGSFAAWAGQANVRKTTAAIMQLHCMKAGALYGVGEA